MKRTTVFKILTLLYLVAVAVLCFAKFSSLPTVPGKFLGMDADKVVHFLMFFPFPLLAYLSFPLERKGIFVTVCIIVLIFAVGCCLAGVTEYVQGRLPYRTMDIADFRADMLGMLSASVITFLLRIFIRPAGNAKA
ncbi:MAG: VanZ family protein [Bacteroidales bacterium]|nr:VanZ family protein [Bacteroidales bacterium]